MQAALLEVLSADEEVPLSVQNDITDIKRDVAVIRERLDWHFRIGAGAIVVFTGLFAWPGLAKILLAENPVKHLDLP